ncbi:MAG: PAS domain S-box protein [Thermodesulfobacteriota bacterium]
MRFKYSLLYLILAILIMVAGSSLFIGFYLNANTLQETMEAREASEARDITYWVNADIQKTVKNISTLSQLLKQNDQLVNSLNQYQAHGEVKPLQETINSLYLTLAPMGVDFLMVTDSRGKIAYQASDPEHGGLISLGWGLEEALAGETILETGYGPQGWAIRTLTPLSRETEQCGVLILGIFLDDAFARKIAAATHTSISFSTPYQIMASSWPPGERQKVGLPWVTRSLNEKRSFFHIDPQANTSSFHVPLDIGDETVCLVVNTDTTPIHNLLEQKERHLFLSFFGVVIGIIGIGSGLAFSIVRPLRQLQERAVGVIKEFSSKEMAVSRGGNEVATLSQAMEVMLAAIQARLAEIEEAQEALRERENFLASVFASIQDGIVVMDRDFTILRANPSEEHQFRHDLPIVGRKCYELRHGLSQPCEECPCRQAMETGKTGYLLKKYTRGDETDWVETFAYPLQDLASGQVTGVIEYIRDVTERMQAKDDLARKNVEFEAIFNAISDGALFADIQRRVVMANPAFLAMFGWSLEEIIGQTTEFLYNSKAEYEELGKSRYHVGAQPQQTIFERQYRRKDGSPVTCETLGTPVKDKQGQTIGFLAIHRDITARKEAEEALQEARRDWEEIFQAIGQPTFLLDQEQKITAANRAALTALGLPLEEILGRRCYELLHFRSDGPAPYCPMEKLLASGRVETMEMEVEALEGTYLVSCTPVFDGQGNLKKVIHIATDITARKRAEEALRETQERLRLALQGSNTGLWDWDLRTDQVYFSPEWKGQLGYADHEISHRYEEWESRLHPDDRESTLAALQEYFDDRSPEYDIEFRLRHKDGTYRWINARGAVIKDAAGKPYRMMGCHIDISERKQAEEALLVSEERYRSLVENIDLGITLIGSDYRIKMVNNAFGKKFNKPVSEFIGKECFRELEKRNAVCPHCPGRIAMATGKLAEVETEGVRDDGTTFVTANYAFPSFGADGEITGFIEVVQDITERKQAEEALSKKHLELQKTAQQLEQSMNMLQLIMESIPVRVFWKDRESRYLGCNTLFARDAGLSWPGQLVGLDDFAMGWREQAELYRADDRLVMESGLPKMNIIEPQTTPTGDKIWLNTSKVPLRMSNGEVFGVLGVYEDITARKQAEEALAEEAIRRRILVEQSRDGIVVLDETGQVYEANQRYAQMLGYSPEEVSRLYVWDWDAQWTREELLEMLRTVDDTGDHFETRYRRRDGTIFDVEISSNGVVLGGRKLVFCVCRDISRRKAAERALRESEEKYRLLVGQIPAVVFRGYADWSMDTFDDRKIETLTGYPKEDFDSRRRKWSDLVLAEDLPQAKGKFLEGLKTTGTYEREYRIRKKSGEIIWVQVQGRIFLDAHGKIDYISGVISDITARKKAAEALLKYEFIANTAKDCMTLIDRNYLYEAANAAYCQAHGKTREEVVGQSVASIWGQDTFDSTIKPFLDQCFTGQAVEFEGWFPFGKRGMGCYSVSYNPYFNADGTVAYAAVVSHDITQRKRAEEELRKERDLTLSIMESLPGIFYLFDAAGRIARWNKNLEEISKYSAPEIDALHPLDFFTGQDKSRIQEAVQTTFAAGEAHVEAELVSKDGGKTPYLFTGRRITMEGRPFLVGMGLDISARRQMEEALRESEQRFRDIADNSLEWIWEVDAHGKYTYSSSMVERLMGYRPEEILNRNFSEFFHPDDQEELKHKALEIFEAKLPFQEFINRNIHKDGREVWLSTSGVPILDNNGDIIGYRGADTDITKRRQAEDALKESESFLASVFASIQDYITILDRDLNILRVNPARERAFAPEMPLLGKKCYEVLHHASQPCEDCTALRTLETGQPNEKIVTFELAERGGLRHINLSTFPLIDASGQITGVVEVGRDITEQNQAEESIRERESMLSLVINTVPQIIFWKDLNSVYLGCNLNCARAVGLETPGTIVGKTEHDLPWEQEEIETYLAEDRKVIQTRQGEYHKIKTIPLADGRQIWVEATKIPLLAADGTVMGVLGVLDDITERKRMEEELRESEAAIQESERRFRGLVENVPMGIMIIQDGDLVYQNPEQERLFGHLPIQSCRDLLICVHPDDLSKAEQFCQGIMANLSQADITLRFAPLGSTGPEKALIWVNCRSSIIDYRGQKAVLIIMVDISRTKELEFLMLIREKMASLGQVATGIAHEIRNPLSGINVFLESIKENFQDPENAGDVLELIEAAQTASNKIEGVIKRVLDFSRPAALKLARSNINLAVDDALKLTAAKLRKDNVRIDSSLAADLPLVYADQPLLEQAIINMITNAAEALRSTGKPGHIHIATQTVQDAVLIAIEDSGPGIPPAIRDKIFDPFFTTKSDGSGIGLSLCQRIIADHGGNIEVSSSDLGGTKFVIRLPREKRGSA